MVDTKNNYPKNPRAEEALQVHDVIPGSSFAVFGQNGLIERVTFLESATYGEDGWFGAVARIEGSDEDSRFDLYGSGIVPEPNGQWSERFTVTDDPSSWD